LFETTPGRKYAEYSMPVFGYCYLLLLFIIIIIIIIIIIMIMIIIIYYYYYLLLLLLLLKKIKLCVLAGYIPLCYLVCVCIVIYLGCESPKSPS
jgi:hypothetical protein